MANALLLTLCALVTAGLSIAVVRPQLVGGAENGADSADLTASDPVHQTVIEQIAQFMGSSREVLFHHDTDGSPFSEMLLWMTDSENPGEVDAAELALLSFSSTLQALSVFVWEQPTSSTTGGTPQTPPAAMSPEKVRNLAFCRQWRTQPGVVRHTIATQVNDLTWNPLTSYRTSGGHWRITLTWASESADQPDTASITVATGAP